MDEQTVVAWSAWSPTQVEWLPDDAAHAAIEHLKAEADRYWTINAHRSLELAELIVAIGERRGDRSQIALGIMARGDALRCLGRIAEAWHALQTAGDLFGQIDDEYGWARTRIGRLQLCADLGCVEEALADATRARAIFSAVGDHEKLLRLQLNTGNTYYFLGDYRQALHHYDAALHLATTLGDGGAPHLGSINSNSGIALQYLGDFRAARERYERARAIFARRGETSAVADTDLNLAYLEQAEGHYPQALRLLHQSEQVYATERLERDAALVKLDMAECYLALHRPNEARALALHVRDVFRRLGARAEEARALIQLASAHAAADDLAAAAIALDDAEPIFDALRSATWLATIRLWRGRIALQQGDAAGAKAEAAAAMTIFGEAGQEVHQATATLLHGQACLLDGDTRAATQGGKRALAVARHRNIPTLRYSAHLLLGRIAEREHDDMRAVCRFRAAAATIDRVGRRLTLTLRPGFLEDKGEALHALIALFLRRMEAARAFRALEHTKSQALMHYLANREHLRWNQADATSQRLRDELDRLRAEHHWFYGRAYEPSDEAVEPADLEHIRHEIAVRERQMRALSEQLYLASTEQEDHGERAFSSAVLRHRIGEDVLIEFYNDGTSIWAFTVDQHGVQLHPLAITVAALDRLLAQLHANAAGALASGADAAPSHSLSTMARRILHRLYEALLAPLGARWADHTRLYVVPYGVLHVLPFHLLHTGAHYLLEQHEIVVLPTAALLLRPGVVRPAGAVVVGHSWNQRLPEALDEARHVHALVGGSLFVEQQATRNALHAAPTQVLHVAAHGEHRLDQPDLSYLRLHDGQAYADDLLQADLGYELVTLSACETGRAAIAAGDEPIGLGRALLYAGAGALLMSLWRVDDAHTAALMRLFYGRLMGGASKIDALRQAQLAMLAAHPTLHPVYWGAFQLTGDPGPLSQGRFMVQGVS
jgi:CHAT domain-containing protein